MRKNPKAKALWDTASLIKAGGLIGWIAAVVQDFQYALRNEIPEGNLYVSLALHVVIYALAGGLVLGGISFLRNRIMFGKY